MSDSNRITADEDFLHNQTEDFLSLYRIESLSADSEFATKLRQRLGKTQVSRLILRSKVEGVQFGGYGLFVFT